ncbi:MAG: hypothetical protein Q9170_003966, partial [Blastenia crenularia]
MSLVYDQVRRIDVQLDRLHWAKHASSPSSVDSESDGTTSSDEAPVDANRIESLQVGIKLLSTTTARNAPLSSESIQDALRSANLLDHSSAAENQSIINRPSSSEQDFEWLLVSKATAQTHGLILQLLLDQTLPLGWDIWYWGEVLGSPYYLGLYSLQTLPLRVWQWSRDVYGDVRKKLQPCEGTAPTDQTRAGDSITRNWPRFYSLVKESIHARPLRGAQSRIMSPLMLHRSEVRSKQQGLQKMREISACGLGVLVDEGMNLENDEGGVSRAKGDKHEWKMVVLKSVALMETVLRNLTVLDLGTHEFEDMVFTSVEDDTELSHVDISSDDSNQRLALMIHRLKLILQVHVPNHISSSKQLVTKYGRPSWVLRYWLPATAVLLSSSTLLRVAVNRKAELVTWIREFGGTTMDFWNNWVVEPIRKLVGTIRHDKDAEIAIMSKESLQGDQASLERMVVDFARDNPPTTSAVPLNEAELANIGAKVREGDLTPVLRAYEKDLRRPFIGTVRGELIRALLIQVQKTKVDVEVAVGGIDALLKSQELVFGFIGLTPGVLVCFGLFRWLGGFFGGRKSKVERKSRMQMIRLLRNIDRILSGSVPSTNGMLSYKDHGMLLCEIHILRQSAQRAMPGNVFAEFLEEINELTDLRTGIERQLRVADRIKLLLIGDSGVGKSCCLLRFSEDSFTPSFITTIGIDFKIRTIELDGKRVKLQIWDTAGQERFRTITTAYYRGAMGILLVYDVTDERSFNNIRTWFSNVEQHATEGVNKILIGNKCDWEEKRAVSTERGQQLADELGIPFMEVSAKGNINIEKAFYSLAADIKKRIIDTSKPETGASQGVNVADQ